jgi:hypothetical protein
VTTYLFEKSGARVRIVLDAMSYRDQPCVEVERCDTGKRMIVPLGSLREDAANLEGEPKTALDAATAREGSS